MVTGSRSMNADTRETPCERVSRMRSYPRALEGAIDLKTPAHRTVIAGRHAHHRGCGELRALRAPAHVRPAARRGCAVRYLRDRPRTVASAACPGCEGAASGLAAGGRGLPGRCRGS